MVVDDRAQRRGFRYLLVLAGVCLGMLFWQYLASIELVGSSGNFPFQLDYVWLVLAALCGFAALKVKRFGPRSWLYAFLATSLVIAMLMLMVFEWWHPPWSPFDALISGSFPESPLDSILANLKTVGEPILFAAPALAAVLLLSRWYVLPLTLRSEPEGAEFPSNYVQSSRVRAAAFLFGCVLTSLVGYVTSSFDVSYYGEEVPDILDRLYAALPLFIGAGLVIWRKGETLRIDDEGIRLFLFSPSVTLFRAKWPRVRHIVPVFQGSRLAAVVVHYRSRMGWRFSLGIHPGRWAGGETVLDSVLEASRRRKAPERAYRSPGWAKWVALACVVIGLALIPVGHAISTSLMSQIGGDTDSAKNLDRLAGLFPLSAVRVGSLLLLGLGFGISSSLHRGGARPVLMALWAQWSMFVPDHLIHWLVWIAIFAIYNAILTPLIRFEGPFAPPLWQMELAIDLVIAGPLIAILGYMAGVVLLRRRVSR